MIYRMSTDDLEAAIKTCFALAIEQGAQLSLLHPAPYDWNINLDTRTVFNAAHLTIAPRDSRLIAVVFPPQHTLPAPLEISSLLQGQENLSHALGLSQIVIMNQSHFANEAEIAPLAARQYRCMPNGSYVLRLNSAAPATKTAVSGVRVDGSSHSYESHAQI